MNKSLSRILTLSNRNLKEILREPLSLIFIIVLPLLMEVLFYIIFNEVTSQFEMKYLAPSIVVFSQAFLTLFIGLLISLDRSSAFLTRLFVTKTKASEFILSYLLSIIPIVLIQSVLFFTVGIIIDPSLLKIEVLYAILLSIVTSVFFISLGILLGALCNEKSIGGVSSMVVSAHSILSGMWFPTEGLNENFNKFIEILPFKNTTVLVQNIISGINNPFDDFFKPLIIVLIYSFTIFSTSLNFIVATPEIAFLLI